MVPAVQITFFYHGRQFSTIAIVDTGADRSIIKGEIARELGIPIERGKQMEVTTLGGPAKATLHDVEVCVMGDEKISIEAAVIKNFDFPYSIAGRDLLESYELTVFQKQKQIRLKEVF